MARLVRPMSERIARYVPITQWLPRYQRSFLGSDLLGGLAVWAVLVPQAVAYAALAGAPPEAGLATALAAGVLYAIFGTCRELDVGPSSTIAITAAAALAPVAATFPAQEYTALLAALSLLTGVVLVVAGALRLGFVAEFLARPVIVGFISGIGVLIIVGQLPKLLGLTVESGNVPEMLWREIESLDDISWETPLVGCLSLAALLSLRRVAPRVPWALVVTAVAVIASRAFDLEAHGVAVIADVPGGLPTPALPGIGMSQVGALSSGAIALALVALAESIGTARSLASQRGYEIDPNQELIALGASNLGAGLVQGFPVDASLSRSAVGAGAGVRTRLAGLFVALLIVATMLFLTPLFDGLPQATLAAIIIAAVIGLVDISGFRWLWRVDQGDARLAIVGFAAVALLGVLPGIAVAVVASLLALIRRAYRPRIAVLGHVPHEASADENFQFRSVDRHPEYETIPGLVLFRFANELFFANASYFRDETLRLVDESNPRARTVLVDASVISHADTTALAMLDDLLDQLQLRGVTLEFARARTDLMDLLDRTGISERIGPAGFHRSVHAGVASFLQRSPSAT
jgi:high affinity sulfate transporter 1